jgi:hypothetical protein
VHRGLYFRSTAITIVVLTWRIIVLWPTLMIFVTTLHGHSFLYNDCINQALLGIRTCSVKPIVLITRQNVVQLSRSQTEGVKRTEISIDHDV